MTELSKMIYNDGIPEGYQSVQPLTEEKICIGVVTRDRPRMLSNLVYSFENLVIPPQVMLVFAIVENRPEKTLNPVLDGLDSSGLVIYQIEPKPGIPFARNRVLRISRQEGCNFTAFIDDDEIADPNWINALYQNITTRDLDLVGGAVKLLDADNEATFLQCLVWRGLVRRNRRVEKKAARLKQRGLDGRVTIVTNNWMVRNAFLERTGMQFDEALGLSGGSDTAFFKEGKRKGVRSGWVSDAFVYEEMPETRLTFRYQFERAMDQAIASFRLKYPSINIYVVLRSIGFFLIKTIAASLLLLVAIFSGGDTLTGAVRSLGFAVGRIRALLGTSSTHYETTHGY